MAHLFNLCIKDDNSSSDAEMIVTLEDNANPISTFPEYVNHLNLLNPKFIITYKQNN